MNSEKSFQGHENAHQQQQPDPQAEDIYRERKKVMLRSLEDFHTKPENRKLKAY
jgi:hypothetical protein